MKTMDSVCGPNQHEGKWTSVDLEVRDDQSHNIPTQWYGAIVKCWGLTHSSSTNTDEGYSESDPLLPNDRLSPSIDDEGKTSSGAWAMPSESICTMVLQILAPFLLAGFGTVMAGMLLDIVQVSMARLWAQKEMGLNVSLRYFCVLLRQHWDVFQKVTEIFILVPALLGMKGNLEMTMASRLSTVVSK